MMKIISAAFLLLAFQICLATAQEIQIVTEEWSPYNFTEEGKIIGISTEIVRETLNRAGVNGTITVYPWARAYNMALTEPNTLIYTIYRNEQRENQFHWIGPIYRKSSLFLFKLAERTDINIISIEEAKQYLVGALKDNYSHQKLLELGFEETVNLEIVKSTENNILMLLAGRIDMFPGDEIATGIIIKEMGIESGTIVKEISILNRQSNAYMAFSIGTSEALVQRVRSAFVTLSGGDFIEKTMEKYRYIYE